MTNTVKNTHAKYDLMLPEWTKCRDAACGERAVHLAAEKYLPRLEEEEDASYQLRLNMTPFFNATWRTITGLKGIMFRKAPSANVPNAMLPFMDNIDLTGSDMSTLSQEVAEEALTVGRVGLMVDYPTLPEDAITQADVDLLGLRTLISVYKTENIINWRTKRVNGALVLSMVVLTEETEIEVGEFEHKSETRYRVLDLINGVYRQRLFRIDEKSDEDELLEEFYPQMNNAPLGYIPFVFIGVDSVTSEVDDPPLSDLVSVNFKHYGQATSYERGCFFSGLPTMFVTGVPEDRDEPIYIGGATANVLPNPQATAFYAEIKGDFTALRNNLTDKKSEMAALGARMLEETKAGVEAAETVARRQVGEESILSAMARTISQGLTQALKWFAAWQNIEGEVVYELNRDFLQAKMDAATLTALMGAWQAGGISYQTFFNNLKQGELIKDEVTVEEEQARINENPPIALMSNLVDPSMQGGF